MKETYRMWKIVRYLKKRRFDLVRWDNEKYDRKASNTGVVMPEFIQRLTNILEQNREPRIIRMLLASRFGTDLYWGKDRLGADNENEVIKKNEEKEIEIKMDDAQDRISSSITAKFFDVDENDIGLIFLTLKGKKFASRYGLVKEWAIEDIGPFWSVVGSLVLGAVGAIKFDVLIGWGKAVIKIIQ